MTKNNSVIPATLTDTKIKPTTMDKEFHGGAIVVDRQGQQKIKVRIRYLKSGTVQVTIWATHPAPHQSNRTYYTEAKKGGHGYDKTTTAIIDALEKLGFKIKYEGQSWEKVLMSIYKKCYIHFL